MKHGTALKRYLALIGPPDERSCRSWRGAKGNRLGHGKFYFGGKPVWAHRFGYEAVIGPIPSGMEVCHSCDNGSCQTPEHWWLGTHEANMRDCNRKGRSKGGSLKGEQHPMVKLTEAQVNDIRAKRESGTRQVELAREFDVSQSLISAIVTNKLWRHTTLEVAVIAVDGS